LDSIMVRHALVAANLLFFSIVSPAIAQRGGPSRDRSGGGGGSIPAVGTMLPTVTAIDEQGEKFSTASLRGSYTVLVFGCLT
jgi:cytochrome oxidase Cu insertion factor (SCO1/SenC/PrrC family)